MVRTHTANENQEPTAVVDKSDASWHVDRKIPVALIISLIGMFLGQTATAAWMGAKLDARVDVLEKARALDVPTMANQGERLTRVEERLNALQTSVNTGFADVKALIQTVKPSTRKPL